MLKIEEEKKRLPHHFLFSSVWWVKRRCCNWKVKGSVPGTTISLWGSLNKTLWIKGSVWFTWHYSERTLTVKTYMLLACKHVASEATCNHFQLRVISQNVLRLVRLRCIVGRQNIISSETILILESLSNYCKHCCRVASIRLITCSIFQHTMYVCM